MDLKKLKENLNRIASSDPVRFMNMLAGILKQDYLGLIAAGVAFYFFLAVFPALAAVISIYGLFANPVFVADQVGLLSRFLPPEALKILTDQAHSIVKADEEILGISFLISVFLAVYSATKGVNALINGLNIANNVRETRNFMMLNVTAFTLTFIMLGYFLIAISVVAVVPVLVALLPLPSALEGWLLLARWPLLFIAANFGLNLLYYYAPAPQHRAWHSFNKGSVMATGLWLVMSSLFSVFIRNFGNYNETYGSISAVVILLLWFWMSALTILFGAEVNTALKAWKRGKQPQEHGPEVLEDLTFSGKSV